MLVREEGAGLFSLFCFFNSLTCGPESSPDLSFSLSHGEVPQDDPGDVKLCSFQPCPWPSAGAVG